MRVRLAIILVLLVAAPVLSYQYLDFGEGPTRWPDGNTILYLNLKNFPAGSAVGTSVRNAVDSWNSVEELAFWFSRADNSSKTFWLDFYTEDMDADGFNDVMAVAGVYLDPDTYSLSVMRWNERTRSDELFDVDVLFNANLNWSTTGNPGVADLQSVALHEFGHVLGLGEEPAQPNAVMYPFYTPGLLRRKLHPDDEEGARFLYPSKLVKPIELPPGTTPEPLEIEGLEVSRTAARTGEMFTVTGRVRNLSDLPASVNSLLLTPDAVVRNVDIKLAPGEEKEFSFDATVVAAPGLYRVKARVVGYRGGGYFASEHTAAPTEFRVERSDLGYTMQDSLAAELGPGGEDRIRLPLVKGTRVWIELRRGAYSWAGDREVVVTSPSGRVVRTASGPEEIGLKPFRAKEEGDYLIGIRNLGGESGEYVLVSDGLPKKSRVKAKATFEPTVRRVEVGLPALPARSEVNATFTVSGKARKTTAPPLIVGYRTPSGFRIDLEEPIPALENFPLSENGVYRLILELPGAPPTKRVRVKLKGRVVMVDGVANRH